jgi:hypothetical protein
MFTSDKESEYSYLEIVASNSIMIHLFNTKFVPFAIIKLFRIFFYLNHIEIKIYKSNGSQLCSLKSTNTHERENI